MAAMTTLPCLISAGCPWKENFTTLSFSPFDISYPCLKINYEKTEKNMFNISKNKQHGGTLHLVQSIQPVNLYIKTSLSACVDSR
jgi:hypothetical protein